MTDEKPKPRRKLPNRSKSTDGGLETPKRPSKGRTVGPVPRRQAPKRSKSFDDTDPRGAGGGLTKSKSVSGKSMRNMLSTANSVKNVMVAGAVSAPEQAIKVHKLLTTKAPKARPGAMPITALSSRNVMAEQQRGPLSRALSSDKLMKVRPSRGRSGDSSESRGGKSPSRSVSPATKPTRRAGRKPGRSLTPANGRKRAGVEDDKDKDYISIM